MTYSEEAIARAEVRNSGVGLGVVVLGSLVLQDCQRGLEFRRKIGLTTPW